MSRMPGIQARGYLVELDGGREVAGTTKETFTCCHCPRVTVIERKAKPEELGRFCHKCNRMTCKQCGQNADCVPYMRKIDEFLRKAALHRAMGLA